MRWWTHIRYLSIIKVHSGTVLIFTFSTDSARLPKVNSRKTAKLNVLMKSCSWYLLPECMVHQISRVCKCMNFGCLYLNLKMYHSRPVFSQTLKDSLQQIVSNLLREMLVSVMKSARRAAVRQSYGQLMNSR